MGKTEEKDNQDLLVRIAAKQYLKTNNFLCTYSTMYPKWPLTLKSQ